jgi:formylglycine-generating enzyme required for sulfatase activity
MAKSKIFQDQYPTIARFVEAFGWIEIGEDEMVSAFVRAYDMGGTVYEWKSSYPSLEAAFQDLEAGIKAYIEENGIDLS